MQILALLSSALVLIVLDQSTKALVQHRLGQTQTLRLGFVVLRHHLNRRAYFRPSKNKLSLATLLVAEFAALMAVAVLILLPGGATTAVALGVGAGGACSNVIDHMRHEGVVDFIDLGWWPVFNLADLAIVVGATWGLLGLMSTLVAERFGVA